MGALIFQLVLHHPFHGAQSWPARKSPEWNRLGPKGNRWRELCNRLTRPEQTESITLESIAQQVQSLRARPSAVTPGRLMAVGALLLAGLLAAAAMVYPGYARQWKEFCAADDQWLDQFRHDLTSDSLRLRIEQDPSLSKAVGEIQASGEDLDPKHVSGNQTMMISELAVHPPLTISAYRKTPPALDVIHHVENALSADHWPLLQHVTHYQKLYEKWGWQSASAYLKQFTDGVALDRQLAAGIDKLLRRHPGSKTISSSLTTVGGRSWILRS